MSTAAAAVRQATLADLPGIREVAAVTWWDTYRGILPDEVITWFVERAYAPERLAVRLENAARLLVAVRDDQVLGFAQFHRRGEVDADLVAFYVLPAEQGNGLGSAMLAQGLQDLAPVAKLYLEVEEGNQKGRAFYARKGFQEVRRFEHKLFDHVSPVLELMLDVRNK